MWYRTVFFHLVELWVLNANAKYKLGNDMKLSLADNQLEHDAAQHFSRGKLKIIDAVTHPFPIFKLR